MEPPLHWQKLHHTDEENGLSIGLHFCHLNEHEITHLHLIIERQAVLLPYTPTLWRGYTTELWDRIKNDVAKADKLKITCSNA